jgi:hypothetical protein
MAFADMNGGQYPYFKPGKANIPRRAPLPRQWATTLKNPAKNL